MFQLLTCWKMFFFFHLHQIDLTEALQSWATTNSHVCTDKLIKAEPVWRDAAFTLKYHSDALFDFPYWFGFSKRSFKVIPGWSSLFLLAFVSTSAVFCCLNSTFISAHSRWNSHESAGDELRASAIFFMSSESDFLQEQPGHRHHAVDKIRLKWRTRLCPADWGSGPNTTMWAQLECSAALDIIKSNHFSFSFIRLFWAT